MGEIYDLHQHPFLMVIYIQKTDVRFDCYSTVKKEFSISYQAEQKDACIVYDKQKMNIKSWGYGFLKRDEEYGEYDEYYYGEDEDKDDIYIDNFRDEVYRLFKTDKDEWNEDDLFLLEAVSEFIELLVEEKMEKSFKQIKSTDELHYIFVVPSEWEEEIREDMIRPIFIQSNLISKNDHNDRLLFCSDLESIFYGLMEKNKFIFEKIRKTIFCISVPISEDEILIKWNLVSTVNPLFDFPGSLLFPKVERSSSLYLTINTFKEGTRAFIKDKLPLAIQEEIIQIIMDTEFEEDEEDKNNKESYFKKPLITDASRWELDKRQQDFIRRICIFDICSQVCKNTTNNIDVLLSIDIIKEYNFFSTFDHSCSEIGSDDNLLNWSRYLLTYNRTYSHNKYIKYTSGSFGNANSYCDIIQGARRYGQDAISNANIYSRPRILPVKNPANSSSIFRESKPDAIMNIDISIESTILSFSLLDENGFVKEVWNHDDFLKDKSLCSLVSFFIFSETTTLNVKSSFIEFAKDYLMDNVSFISGDKNNSFLQLSATKIETILCKDSYAEDLLVSTQQQIYIKAFVLLYITYIKYVISNKLSNIVDPSMEIKIGYNITVGKILLDRLFSTKDGLKDIIYTSGLIQKDDYSKKLRITAQGERIMYLLRQSLDLPFPLKSYFVLAQLHENYIQLTLNQVVTESSSGEENQESIIIRDKIIHIPNVYTSLCLNMWNNIVEDSSLIKLCDIHQEYSDNDLLEIFSLKNQAELIENLKQYISKNKFGNNSSQPATDKIDIPLSVSCNCRVYLTVRDIMDVFFQPVLQDIASLVSASFINKELFGKFWNIQYFFQLIQFDYNSQLQNSLIKMLKETTEDVLMEQGVDIPHYVITKSLNQLLQPIHHQQPISYKEFEVGTLHLVYGDRYGFCVWDVRVSVPLACKSETTNTKIVSLNEKIIFQLFKRGDLIYDLPKNLTLYLSVQEKTIGIVLGTEYDKLKMSCDLNSDGAARVDDILEKIIGPSIVDLPKELKTGQYIPILSSVLYEAYSGSLILTTKLVGQDTYKSVTLGIPMHLSRF